MKRETILARDKYGNKIYLCKNQTNGFDFQTDGRVYLSPTLARKLIQKLTNLLDANTLSR